MRSISAISIISAMLLCAGVQAFAQVETAAKETLEAYKNKDAALLKKHVSGIYKNIIDDNYFNRKSVQEHMKAIESWNGEFKGIRYGAGKTFGRDMKTAMVYYADSGSSDKIYTIALAKMGENDWVLVGDGLVLEDTEEFNKLSREIPSQREIDAGAVSRKFSMEMANGETTDSVSLEKLKEWIGQLDDDNFFIILKDGDNFIQAAYSEMGYDIQYKENGKQFIARDYLTKDQAISAFTGYYNGNDDWKNFTEWDKA